MTTSAPGDSPPTNFRKFTPVFLVDEIEPCLGFWVDRIGFELAFQTKDQTDVLGFVILKRDDVEIMYQTRASLDQDLPGIAGADHSPWIVNYIEVESLDEILPKLDGIEILAGPRPTFYGAQEVFVREPSGRVIAFASRRRDNATGGQEAA
jgi:catechol 2,3-dioxygenase-like lactoylglutathione lyase family enzyme